MTTDAIPSAPQAPEAIPSRAMQWLIWILIPVIGFAVTESKLRESYIAFTAGWHTVSQMSGDKHIDAIFIGTSRTFYGVDEERFSSELSKLTGRRFFSYNIGAGDTRLTFNYMGLRNLYHQHPAQVRGCIIFIEAPGGIPEYLLWTDEWTYQRAEQLLVPNMQWEDLPRLWRSHMTTEKKLDMTTRFLFFGTITFAQRHIIRYEFFLKGQQFTEGLLLDLGAKPRESTELRTDKFLREGIKTVEDINRNAKKLFDDYYIREKDMLERPWREWDKSILGDLVTMVQRNGGRVVFFEIPQTSMFDRIYHTPMREEDRIAFEKQAAIWGTPILRTNLVYTDEDFPDHFHLSTEKSPEFSALLARKYAETVLGVAPAP